MIITYLVFGEELKNYQQAYFSILTFLEQLQASDSIVVITDNPQNFSLFEKQITLIKAEKKQLQEWRGKYDFFWRIKIKAVEYIMQEFRKQPILYLDSDTFLYKDLNDLRNKFHLGINCMHTKEGKLSRLPTKTERKMWQQIKYKKFASILIDKQTAMWNAGAIGIAPSNFHQIEQVLQMCDEMCKAGVTRRLIEQFSFSVVLNNEKPLAAAEHTIGHYWGNKESWNEVITKLICEAHMQNLSIEQQMHKAVNINFTQLPIRKRIPNTRLRLEKKLQTLLPDKSQVYLPKN